MIDGDAAMENNHLHANGMVDSQFLDTNFPFYDVPHFNATGQADGKMEGDSGQYVFPVTDAAQHGGASTLGPDTHSGQDNMTPGIEQPADIGSQEGSGEESPESNRARGLSPPDIYDEFGLNDAGAADGTDLGKQKEDKNETPAWTELKTKAGKERKRLPLACIACRRKKIRCSGEKPACKHCLRSRIPCVYKVTTRKAAPRTDYMAMLDKRLRRMEDRIIKIIPKDEQDPTTIIRAQVKPPVPGTAQAKPANPKKRLAQEAFGAELETWATSTKASNQGVLPASLLAQEAEESKLLVEGADALPSREIQEHLAEVFFDQVYGQAYHVLHKPSYMRKLKAQTLPPVLILAVCAVSARFSTHPKLNTQPAFLRGEPWAAEARSIVLKRYEWPNITILTCLLLLGLHEFGTCYGGRSWALGGMAIRMAYALQLHRDLDHDPCKPNSRIQLSFVDREIRRRTMWACFLMDRFNSSGTDRPMFVKEETIEVQLPIKEQLFQLDMEGPTEDMEGNVPYPSSGEEGELSNARDNMGVAAYMIRSIAMWGRTIIYHCQGGRDRDPYQIWEPQAQFASLLKQSTEFIDNLPESLKFTQENLNAHETDGLANQFLFLHITSQQNILLLNHNAVQGHRPRRPRADPPRDFVETATKTAFEAANRISELLRAAELYPVNAPFAGYCAFLSSTVQMAAAFSEDEAVASLAKKNLATNVRYLTKMKRYWGAFHWTSEQLKKHFKSCADAAKRGMHASGSNTITQYADWFTRYPHGVSQSDFEGPGTVIKKEKGDDAVLEHKSDLHTVEEFFHANAPAQPAEAGKANKRKKKTAGPASAKSTPQSTCQATPPPQQQQHSPHSVNLSAQPIHIPDHTISQPQQPQPQNQIYNNHISPNSFLTPQQSSFYSQDLLFPPQLSMMPHLDRHLVFGAYAGLAPSDNQHQLSPPGGDGSGGAHAHLDSAALDAMAWEQTHGLPPGLDVHPSAWAAEATSAWFMPFNMQPPDVGSDAELFASLGLGGAGGEQGGGAYGMEMGVGGVDGLGQGQGQRMSQERGGGGGGV